MKKMITNINDKITLRKSYLELLKKVSKTNNQKWSNIILTKFKESHYFKQNQVFAVYNALSYEVATKDIIELLWKNDKPVCAPRIIGEKIEFYYISSWDDVVIDNNFKIKQPLTTCKKVTPSEINCMLIPMIAFDQNYYRIGYGKGFYDRYLNQNNLNFSKIGLAFAIQEIPFVMEHDSWDMPLDFVFTN